MKDIRTDTLHTDGWDTTPRSLPPELEPKPYVASGQVPTPEGHIINTAAQIEASSIGATAAKVASTAVEHTVDL